MNHWPSSIPGIRLDAATLRNLGPFLVEHPSSRAVAGVVLALSLFAVMVAASGRDPFDALLEAWNSVLGSSFGLSSTSAP